MSHSHWHWWYHSGGAAAPAFARHPNDEQSKAGVMNIPFTQPLRQRLAYLRWSLPLAIGLLAVLYELGPGRWIHDVYGEAGYFSLDILFYATIAPLLIFWVLTRIGHWLDDKER